MRRRRGAQAGAALAGAALVGILLAPLAGRAATPSALSSLPADSGIIDARAFGAVGDGRHDDTQAILRALAQSGGDDGPTFWTVRPVFLPAGTYLVSDTLLRRYRSGKFAAGFFLVGAGESRTRLRLADHARGFGDPAHPRPVIMTTAKLLDGTPTSGGKDYDGKGEGNDAYENFIEDLAIEIGDGNAGAIGIDYLANNIGAIRNVAITAPPGSGSTGIAMLRKWPGPALLSNLRVQGFGIGIDVAQTEYGLTLDRITLADQRAIGLRNADNMLAAHALAITGAPTPLANSTGKGLIVVDRGTFSGASFANSGWLVLHGVTAPGLPSELVLEGAARRAPAVAPAVALRDAPDVTMPQDWRRATRLAGNDANPPDITADLQAAVNSGAAGVYLPYGRYRITRAITLPPSLRVLAGVNAALTVTAQRDPGFARSSGMLRVSGDGPPLLVEGLVLDMTNLGTQLGIEQGGARSLVLRDIVTAGTMLLDRTALGGPVFIENVCCGAMRIAGPASVMARQFDSEGGGPRIVNAGAPLAVLGLKTEGPVTVLRNLAGARSAILGGLFYMVAAAPNPPPLLTNDADGRITASFVEESLRAASRYRVYLRQGGNDLAASAFPARGDGRIVADLPAAP